MTIEEKAFVAALNEDAKKVAELLGTLTWRELELVIDAAELLIQNAEEVQGERS